MESSSQVNQSGPISSPEGQPQAPPSSPPTELQKTTGRVFTDTVRPRSGAVTTQPIAAPRPPPSTPAEATSHPSSTFAPTLAGRVKDLIAKWTALEKPNQRQTSNKPIQEKNIRPLTTTELSGPKGETTVKTTVTTGGSEDTVQGKNTHPLTATVPSRPKDEAATFKAAVEAGMRNETTPEFRGLMATTQGRSMIAAVAKRSLTLDNFNFLKFMDKQPLSEQDIQNIMKVFIDQNGKFSINIGDSMRQPIIDEYTKQQASEKPNYTELLKLLNGAKDEVFKIFVDLNTVQTVRSNPAYIKMQEQIKKEETDKAAQMKEDETIKAAMKKGGTDELRDLMKTPKGRSIIADVAKKSVTSEHYQFLKYMERSPQKHEDFDNIMKLFVSTNAHFPINISDQLRSRIEAEYRKQNDNETRDYTTLVALLEEADGEVFTMFNDPTAGTAKAIRNHPDYIKLKERLKANE